MSTTETYTVTMGERGRLVLPARLREELGLEPGDRLILTVCEDRAIRLVSARDLAERLHGIYKDLAPGRSLVDELIAERREEARHEEDD